MMPKVAIWRAKLAKNFAELRAVNDCEFAHFEI